MNDQISGIFYFDPTDNIYKDHFPGNPVVPGSIIVQAFVEAGKRHGIKPENIQLENFRFKRFISPGEYHYHINAELSRITCKLYDGNQTVVTGIILQ
jgi:3-hydroxyacyl-[acyl-carrier-protein] dehydratase